MYNVRVEWLNYHHLLYFWVTAKEGSIRAASEKLLLAQPTISAQIHALEKSLGVKLFDRVGRNLAITEAGRVVYRYADQIFSLGGELVDTVKGQLKGAAVPLNIGVTDAMPKRMAYRFLQPAISMPEQVRLVCYEGTPTELLKKLATHELGVVLSDAPVGSDIRVRAFNHLLGECGISILAVRKLANRYHRRFPQSLDASPFLMPTHYTSLRSSLEHWFDSEGIHPAVVGEFQDSALLKAFGREGKGLFAVPTVIEKEIMHQYAVQLVGRIEAIREKFYAITVERKVTHPAVVAIVDAARGEIFA